MAFAFDTRKLIHAVAFLLRMEAGQKMGKKRLLALLYLAERRSLQESGRPMIGGRIVSLKHGPIHSIALDLINGSCVDEPEWPRHFAGESYRVVMVKDRGSPSLSRYEIDLLTELSSNFAGHDDFDVAEQTHLSEWRKTYKEGKAVSIPFETLLDEVGRSADKESILQDAKEKSYFDSLFGRRPK